MDASPSFFDALRRRLGYALSLPERTLRSLAALAGGTSTLITDTLLPESLRGTTTYTVTIGMLQRFVIERVAGIEKETPTPGAALSDDYLQRKMAGTALEAAGLLVMRSSPLWVFAIAGDAAGGSKVFLNRLATHLKSNAIIDPETEVTDLVDLLEAVQEASKKSATALDMPPLSRKDLEVLAREMAASYRRAFKNTANLVPQLDSIWQKMEQIVQREHISLERLGGIMTVDAAGWLKKGAGTVAAVGKTGVELFDENILESYRRTLSAVAETGANRYIAGHLGAFFRSAGDHFDAKRETWTERTLTRRSRPDEEAPA